MIPRMKSNPLGSLAEMNATQEKAKRVTEMLHALYKSPDLDNQEDPVDELFFILLSQATNEAKYVPIFNALKKWGGDWARLPDAQENEVAQIIRSAGLANIKAPRIIGSASCLRKKFGHVTLDKVMDRSDVDLEACLTSLPGVGMKTAKCVMMFSMGRQVLPVDTHVHRVATRIGLVYCKNSNKRCRDENCHKAIEATVPESERYQFHVNVLMHGRKICHKHNPYNRNPRKRGPECEKCQIREECAYWHHSKSSSVTEPR